jgi:choline-sulfatase
VPTFGDYFRAAGYNTYWRGKCHASDADMRIPGTDTQLLSYDPNTGVPNSANEALYQNADRLGGYGFSGWIGPEPHGSAPLNSGSSVPPGQLGRDIGFAQQAASLIQQLDKGGKQEPWFIVASFVNPHDITLSGLWVNTGRVPGFDFTVEPYVPSDLFDASMFAQTQNDDLTKKPSAQASYQASYAKWMQPILDDPPTLEQYIRYYYQLLANVDDQMMTVFRALQQSKFRDDTIVLFTSDHGDLLGSHYDMHQKWYTAYDEAIRVPLIIHNKKLVPQARSVDSLTSHIDLLPTLPGLADLDPEPLRQQLAQNHSDALPLVGRDLSPLVLGEVASVDDPLYFMTDDDPSRGLNQDNWTGIAYNSVAQPNHIESVIARLGDGNVWKHTHYFDNPQFWSTPGTIRATRTSRTSSTGRSSPHPVRRRTATRPSAPSRSDTRSRSSRRPHRRVRDVQRDRRSDGAVEPPRRRGPHGAAGSACAAARAAALREAGHAAERQRAGPADLLSRRGRHRALRPAGCDRRRLEPRHAPRASPFGSATWHCGKIRAVQRRHTSGSSFG